jgi:hypothetical protein
VSHRHRNSVAYMHQLGCLALRIPFVRSSRYRMCTHSVSIRDSRGDSWPDRRILLGTSRVSCLMTTPEPNSMPLPVPHPLVVARTLPDGCVLFHPLTEVYFGLNATGTVVWEALAHGVASEEALVSAVRNRFPDAPAMDTVCHVRELLADLCVEGLLVDSGVPSSV